MSVSSIFRVSDYNRSVFYKTTLGQQTALRDKLSARLSTGVQHQHIGDYKADLSRLLMNRNTLELHNRNKAGLEVVRTYLQVTQDALRGRELPEDGRSGDGIAGVMTMLTGMMQSLRGHISGRNVTAFSQWQQSVQPAFENSLRRVTELMNTRVGQRHVFAGRDYKTAPVRDLSADGALVSYTLDAVQAIRELPQAAAFSRNAGIGGYRMVDRANNALAAYHNGFAAWQAAGADQQGQLGEQAYSSHAVNVQRYATIRYGVDSMNEAFQTVVEALRAFGTLTRIDVTADAGFDFNAQRQVDDGTGQLETVSGYQDVLSLFERTEGLMARAGQALNDLADNVGLVEAQVAGRQEVIDEEIRQLTLRTTEITQVDTIATTVQLSALNQQIQASYQSILAASRLSLVNFL